MLPRSNCVFFCSILQSYNNNLHLINYSHFQSSIHLTSYRISRRQYAPNNLHHGNLPHTQRSPSLRKCQPTKCSRWPTRKLPTQSADPLRRPLTKKRQWKLDCGPGLLPEDVLQHSDGSIGDGTIQGWCSTPALSLICPAGSKRPIVDPAIGSAAVTDPTCDVCVCVPPPPPPTVTPVAPIPSSMPAAQQPPIPSTMPAAQQPNCPSVKLGIYSPNRTPGVDYDQDLSAWCIGGANGGACITDIHGNTLYKIKQDSEQVCAASCSCA